MALFTAMIALASVAIIYTLVSSRTAASPLLDDNTIEANREIAATILPAEIALAKADETEIMLPIFENEVTAIGYHPVNGDGIISLEPYGRRINGSIFNTGLGGAFSGNDGPGYFIMENGGEFGSSSNAMDIGAPAGTIIYAPVDGIIAGIRTYDLRGQCADTEIRIQSQSQSEMLIVLTHIDNLEAALGQPVKAGVSRLGAVRKLDGCYAQPLGDYTYDNGNHVHMQAELYGYGASN